MIENRLVVDKHYLLCFNYIKFIKTLTEENKKELDYLLDNFCGIAVHINPSDDISEYFHQDNFVYVTGQLDDRLSQHFNVIKINNLYTGSDIGSNCMPSHIPINIHNMGVYFRNYFDDKDYFREVSKAHQFQDLTESNKPNMAFRKGVYITKVDKHNDAYKFHLLRCSSNFTGPTDNTREIDDNIISNVNIVSKSFFERPTQVNHVLAQIYNNFIDEDGKDKKAKIKEHSDKTKDMPKDGLMAFCSFYNQDELSRFKQDGLDYKYKHCSVLTSMKFRQKDTKNSFELPLYPNSLFLMDLSANRLYTHEIIPSNSPVGQVPTRMGYVIRSSKTLALHKNEQTYIENKGEYVKLEQPEESQVAKLKELYALENRSREMVEYPFFNFSLNAGDYSAPNL